MRLLLLLSLLLGHTLALAQTELQQFPDCELVPTEWGDGDSFLVRTVEGKEFTVRLYGVDCLETAVVAESDLARLRAQRRHFGITGYGGSFEASVQLAKDLGAEATTEARKLLSKPFTVHTAFADGRGDPRFPRVYAFVVTADGADLGEHLVSVGLARAFGVSRGTYDGRTQEEYREGLRDLELKAAKLGRGAWRHTDWETLSDERRQQRDEEREFEVAKGGGKLGEGERIPVNSASRDDLMRIPGIGEKRALGIIDHRPHSKPEDLLRVPTIGEATLDSIREFLDFSKPTKNGDAR